MVVSLHAIFKKGNHLKTIVDKNNTINTNKLFRNL